jgi:hypothetical protein
VLEVNGLSDVSVELRLDRRSPFAPIEGVTVAWWKKQPDEYRAAKQERNRSKVGRMARLRGQVETAAPPRASAGPGPWSSPWPEDPAAAPDSP